MQRLVYLDRGCPVPFRLTDRSAAVSFIISNSRRYRHTDRSVSDAGRDGHTDRSVSDAGRDGHTDRSVSNAGRDGYTRCLDAAS